MKIMIVRHAEPDYSIDSLTEKGWREAEYLSENLSKLDAKGFYVSPMGRAKDTASFTLKKLNRTAVEKEWLREFPVSVDNPNKSGETICSWDWLPQDWMTEDAYFTLDKWCENATMKKNNMQEEYNKVCNGLDELLAEHGYHREGKWYRVEESNNDTIIFFCHQGLECVLLSHLLNLPVMALWHELFPAPSSVTTLVTEERRKGIACFRMMSFGDISHLQANGEVPAWFAGRYCECFDNIDERHG